MSHMDEAAITNLLKRAAVACGLARALSAPDQSTHGAVLALQQGFDLPEGESLRRVLSAWQGVPVELLGDEHTRLFGPATRCPPWETAWGDAKRFGGRTFELADIAGMYRAFGLKLSEKNHERPDHIVAQLEFVGALLMQLAWAQADNKAESAEITRDALAQFLQQHAGRWVGAFADAVRDAGAHAAYVAVARAAAEFVLGECGRALVEPQSPVQGAPCAETEPDCVACPMATDPAPGCGTKPAQSTRQTVDGVDVPDRLRDDLSALFGV